MRARKPLPAALWKLTFNPSTGLYEVYENDIYFGLTYDQVQHIKEYLKISPAVKSGFMSQWYNDMSKEEKKKVLVKGLPAKESDDGFWPDE